MKPILFFNELSSDLDLLSLVGGKAKNLARLSQAGFPVPPGFCLTSLAFRHFINYSNLGHLLDQVLNDKELSLEEKAALIRHAFGTAVMPEELSKVISHAYQSLGDGSALPPVAVRSSGISEDSSDRSFAGQHDTILDLRGEQELLDAVMHCWASLWSARSLAYRKQHGLVRADQTLPLVIQKMVSPQWAGVAFTVDPLNGTPVIIVEAVRGSAESLVSGLTNPSRFRLDKKTLAVLDAVHSNVGDPQISEEQIRQVAGLALNVERFSSSPQDIEWAFESDQLYLLQSRPITALPDHALFSSSGQIDMEVLLRRADDQGSEIWSDDNVGEVFPDLVTPLSWSVLEPMGNLAFRSFLRRLGVRSYPEKGLFGRFFGRVYFNQSQFQRLMTRFYPSRVTAGKPGWYSRLRPALALAHTGLRTVFWMPFILRHALLSARRSPDAVLSAPAPETLDENHLWQEIQDWLQSGHKLIDIHISTTIFATLIYTLLEKVVRAWAGGAEDTSHLTSGLEGMRSAEMGYDLAQLAHLAEREPLIVSLLQNGESGDLLKALYDLPGQSDFRSALEIFLEKHGHASLQEFELSYPRWRDQPDYVLGLLRSHLQNKSSSMSRTMETSSAIRHDATAELRRRFGYGIKRLPFELLLWLAQRYSLARENVKYSFVMAHSHLRRLYLELAERLVKEGKLPEVGSIFFLQHQEIDLLVHGMDDPETVSTLVSNRRDEYNQYRLLAGQAPKLFEELPEKELRPLPHPKIQNTTNPKGCSEHDLLQGVSASSGIFTGPARVIQDPSEAILFESGEVLVTRATNPAWSPLLLSAGALVTEIGGLLSHGAIVAREYGLPAVLNVPGVTRLIKTGQIIRVNGFDGTVHILEA